MLTNHNENEKLRRKYDTPLYLNRLNFDFKSTKLENFNLHLNLFTTGITENISEINLSLYFSFYFLVSHDPTNLNFTCTPLAVKRTTAVCPSIFRRHCCVRKLIRLCYIASPNNGTVSILYYTVGIITIILLIRYGIIGQATSETSLYNAEHVANVRAILSSATVDGQMKIWYAFINTQ